MPANCPKTLGIDDTSTYCITISSWSLPHLLFVFQNKTIDFFSLPLATSVILDFPTCIARQAL